MKKWILRILAAGLAVGLCTASVYAVGGHHGFRAASGTCQTQTRPALSCRYTDSDQDGLCDVCGQAAGTKHICRGDADGDGVCDICGQPAGSGHTCRGDSDGDGVCDICGQPAGSCVCAGGGHHGAQGSGGGGHHGHHARGAC